MQIHVKGVTEADRTRAKQAILDAMHQHNIHYDYWSWDWEGPVEVTNDDGETVGEGVNIELPGLEAIRREVPKGLLENISGAFAGVVVYVVVAPVEASLEGNRLK